MTDPRLCPIDRPPGSVEQPPPSAPKQRYGGPLLPRPVHHRAAENRNPHMASNYFTAEEQAHYAYLIECYRAERENRPQPAPTYRKAAA